MCVFSQPNIPDPQPVTAQPAPPTEADPAVAGARNQESAAARARRGLAGTRLTANLGGAAMGGARTLAGA